MNYLTARPDHIEDVLIPLHSGPWFDWSDPYNKIYANLIITNSDYDKPTEKELTDALAKQQSDFDAQEYARNRALTYDSVSNQLDQQYWDSVNGTTTWKDAVAKVKSDNPKPE